MSKTSCTSVIFAAAGANVQDFHYASHGGYWEGYRSYILRFEADRFSVYVLANRTDIIPEDLAFQIFDLFESAL